MGDGYKKIVKIEYCRSRLSVRFFSRDRAFRDGEKLKTNSLIATPDFFVAWHDQLWMLKTGK